MKVFENGRTEPSQYYHQVYTDGKYIYDPRLSSQPIPKGDWEKHIKAINPDGVMISDKLYGLKGRDKMSTYKIPDREGNLLNIIEKASPLEWRRYNQRYPQVKVNNQLEIKDCSNVPPFVAFRFENESEEIINKLRLLIRKYSGFIKWELHEHKRENLPGTNWVIRPFRITEIASVARDKGLLPEEYLSEYEPEFGSLAFDDLNNLTKYIANNL